MSGINDPKLEESFAQGVADTQSPAETAKPSPAQIPADLAGRHASTLHYLEQLGDFAHHTDESIREVAEEFYHAALGMARRLKDGIELSTMLKHFRDAKDAAIRQLIKDRKTSGS